MEAVNPYGLESLWAQGDMIIKTVAVLLVAMSIASWYVIISKAIQRSLVPGGLVSPNGNRIVNQREAAERFVPSGLLVLNVCTLNPLMPALFSQ